MQESTTRSSCRNGGVFEIGFVGDEGRGGRDLTNSSKWVKIGFSSGKLFAKPRAPHIERTPQFNLGRPKGKGTASAWSPFPFCQTGFRSAAMAMADCVTATAVGDREACR